MERLLRIFLPTTLLLLFACSDSPPTSRGARPLPNPSTATKPAPTPPTPPPPAPATGAQLVARGKSVYMSNCIACHSMDPARDGALGPAVTGSSRELLAARVLRAEYPPGYQPKRDTGVMIALPHLENEIAALAAYLNPAD